MYKILGPDGEACHGGSGEWHLPKGKRPGKWMPPIKGDLVPCRKGYHLCREQDLVYWLNAQIYTVEHRGEFVERDDKVVVREARLLHRVTTWNARTARLFAADCAERVLHLYERKGPDDNRVRNAIEVVRRVANGDLPVSELSAAGRDAGAAAWYAASAVAAAAAAAWYAAGDAGDTWNAARAAAAAAAWYAAGDADDVAARADEHRWQTERLMKYLQGEI